MPGNGVCEPLRRRHVTWDNPLTCAEGTACVAHLPQDYGQQEQAKARTAGQAASAAVSAI